MKQQNKYVIITKSINGDLLNVQAFPNQAEVNSVLYGCVNSGYQMTVVRWSVFITANNFDVERAYYGVEKV